MVKNVWKTNPWPLKKARIAFARARGSRLELCSHYLCLVSARIPSHSDTQLFDRDKPISIVASAHTSQALSTWLASP